MNQTNSTVLTWESLDDCRRFAISLAKRLEPPVTVRLDGTLGAGKTQFTKYLAEALGANVNDVTSPTFVLVHRYETKPVLYHLDAYRVNDEDEFLEIGVEEFFDEPAITLIEWGEKFVDVLPKDHIILSLDVLSESRRQVEIAGTGPRSRRMVAEIASEEL
ncbi:MAG: tRNA (adenosine(37)-N6)-threonylcarbamoyltransferase complex ATPase subunit type 1 TsaE [Pirellulaceae bacterium]|nr:tRNA (adenosine(37)-N6)-threonylcarbamoyltransferase complex ATPase subunit type 1 TsaE [Pirellulaceae bacterium]